MLRLTRIRIIDFRSRHQRLQDVGQHLCIRARRQSALLSAPQFSRRDHFHGLGDLPCVGHAADTAPDVENVSHVLLFCRDAAAASWSARNVASYVSTKLTLLPLVSLQQTSLCTL